MDLQTKVEQLLRQIDDLQKQIDELKRRDVTIAIGQPVTPLTREQFEFIMLEIAKQVRSNGGR